VGADRNRITRRASAAAALLGMALLGVALGACGGGGGSPAGDRSADRVDAGAGGRVDGVPGSPITSLRGSAVVAGGNRILQFGGFEVADGKLVPRNDTAVYDVGRGSWSTAAEAPFSAGLHHPAAIWTGKELMVVGAPCGPVSTDVDVADCGTPRLEAAAYDPALDRWRSIPAPPGSFGSTLPPEPTGLGWTGSAAVFRLGLVEGPFAALDPGTGGWAVMPALDEVIEPYCFSGGTLYGVRTTTTAAQVHESQSPEELRRAPIRAWRLDVGARSWKELPGRPKPDVELVSERILCGHGGDAPPLYVPLGASGDGGDRTGLPVLDGVLELRPEGWIRVPRPDLDVFGRQQVSRVARTLLWWPETGDRFRELRDGAGHWTAASKPLPVTPVAALSAGDGFAVVRYGDPDGPLRLGIYRPAP